MLKKYILVAFMLSTVLPFISLSSVVGETNEESDEVHFVVGAVEGGAITTLDPIMYRMAAESEIIEQVTETLFTKNTYDGDVLPNLALTQEFTDTDCLTLELTLRQDVNFTDGTAWNAEALEWNFERMINSIAWGSMYGALLYIPSDGFRTVNGVDLAWLPAGSPVFVINDTEIVDDYTFRILFNVPFDLTSIFLQIGMISPTAHADFLNLPLTTDNGAGNLNWTIESGLVGTGPFEFVSFNAQEGEAKLWANMDYWDGASYITNLTFNYLENPTTLQSALIAEDVDMIAYVNDPSPYENNSNIVYENFGPGIYSCNYVTMYDTVPVPVKEALNYAFNYDYYLDEVMKGTRVKATGVVFPGVEYYNSEIGLPDFNITRARQALIDGGLVAASTVADWTDAEWQAKADSDDPFAEYGLTYIEILQPQAEETREAGRRLGIKVNMQLVEMANFMSTIFNPNRTDTADMHTMGIGLWNDFLTYALFIYDANGPYNEMFLDDAEINGWIGEYLVNVDPEDRQDLVDNIADKIQNELYSAIWIDGPALAAAYNRKWDNVNLYSAAYNEIIAYVEPAEGTITGYSIISILGAIMATMTIVILSKKKHF